MARIVPTSFVGIDFSISSSGVAINNHRSVHISHAPLVAASKYCKQEHIVRLGLIADNIISIIQKFNVLPNAYIFIEDYSFGAVGKTFAIAEGCGILKYKLIFEEMVPCNNIFLVSVGHLKMFSTGKGNSSKDTVLKEVYKRWGFDTNNNDEADAFVLMQIAMSFFKRDQSHLTHFQKEAIKRVGAYNADKKNKKKKAKKV